MSTFYKGDDVYIKRLKRFATVMEEVRPGMYRIVVGSMYIECKEADLEKVDIRRKKKGPATEMDPASFGIKNPPSSRSAQSVDLHGCTVEEALRRVEVAIDRAIIAGLDRLSVVHGLGTGRVREAVHKMLPEIRVVQKFKLDETNPGVTIVYF